ncbi:MAG: hypothetical protein ABIP68_01020 [Ferruginibacter sp.]
MINVRLLSIVFESENLGYGIRSGCNLLIMLDKHIGNEDILYYTYPLVIWFILIDCGKKYHKE